MTFEKSSNFNGDGLSFMPGFYNLERKAKLDTPFCGSDVYKNCILPIDYQPFDKIDKAWKVIG